MHNRASEAPPGAARWVRQTLRSLSLATALLCFVGVLVLMGAPPVLRAMGDPKPVTPYAPDASKVVGIWQLLGPGVAGLGVLMALLAAVLAQGQRQHKAAGILLGILATLFLVLMSQVMGT
jgi:hypothetical protein